MNRTILTALLIAACLGPAIAADQADGKAKEGGDAALDAMPPKLKKLAEKQVQKGKVTGVEEVKVGAKKAYDVAYTDKDGKAHKIQITEGGSVINKDEQKYDPNRKPMQAR